MTMNLSLTSSVGCGKKLPASSISGTCTRILRRIQAIRDGLRHGQADALRDGRHAAPEEYVAGIILPLRRAGEPGVASSPRTFQEEPSRFGNGARICQCRCLHETRRARRLFLAAYSRGRRGSIGGTLIDILARTGVGSLTLIDPEDFAEENVGRHVLTGDSVGKPKVEEWPVTCPYQS